MPLCGLRPSCRLLDFDDFRGHDPVNAFAVSLFAIERQAKLLTDHPGKEAAHGVLLPAGRLHDGGDGRAVRPAQQGKDLFLLGPGAGFRFNRFLSFILFLSGSLWLQRLAARRRFLFGFRGFVAMSDSCLGYDGIRRRHRRSPAEADRALAGHEREIVWGYVSRRRLMRLAALSSVVTS